MHRVLCQAIGKIMNASTAEDLATGEVLVSKSINNAKKRQARLELMTNMYCGHLDFQVSLNDTMDELATLQNLCATHTAYMNPKAGTKQSDKQGTAKKLRQLFNDIREIPSAMILANSLLTVDEHRARNDHGAFLDALTKAAGGRG